MAPFAPAEAHEVGGLLARAGTTDVVDAHAVLVASGRRCAVLTSDPADLGQLSHHLPRAVDVRIV